LPPERTRFETALALTKVMDHKEYDKKLWIEQCGCNLPPPKRKPKK
jgi:hypothetical protein